MSICSIHRELVDGCEMCRAMPWDLFGVTKEVWEASALDAASEGLLTCPNCNFDGMFKKTCCQPDEKCLCPLCGKYFVVDNLE